MSNYGTKSDLKNLECVDTSDFAKKADLTSLKSNVDELNINELKNVPSGLSSLKSKVDNLNIAELETTPRDLSKLSDVLKNVVKKTEYDNLAEKLMLFRFLIPSNLV